MISLIAIFLNPLVKNIKNISYLTTQSTYLETDDFYDQSINFTKNPKNIIFLYLEQFERTYMNEEIFPGLNS